jgi:hypothetical protein
MSQQQAHEDPLMAAYAEGRADERAEWLPVLAALREWIDPFAGAQFTDDSRISRHRALIAKVEAP